jgi:hypothetical protein
VKWTISNKKQIKKPKPKPKVSLFGEKSKT